MMLSPTEFKTRYDENRLKIAFIGMSNIGKSYTATRLQSAYKFQLIEIDSLIIKALGETSMAGFAAWQGQPYEDGYDEREAKSTALETEAVIHALECATQNTLIDTPGSIIYTDKDALRALKEQCLIVYIRAQKADIERLKRDYFKNPKPIVWNSLYKPDPKLTHMENILACFPNLLTARSKAYADLADITLNASFIFDPKTTTSDLYSALLPPVC